MHECASTSVAPLGNRPSHYCLNEIDVSAIIAAATFIKIDGPFLQSMVDRAVAVIADGVLG